MAYPHIFAGNPLDRGETERRDEEWISSKARDKGSRFLPLRDLNVLITEESQVQLGWVGVEELEQVSNDLSPMFLGMQEGATYFAVDVTAHPDGAAGLESGEGRRFEESRSAAEQLSGPDAAILAQARSQLNWHKSHQFCSACGHRSDVGRGGQVRICPNCQVHHFPRTDPVVITVVVDVENDRCLLGQSRGRLARMRRYSALAGFMDQGEAIEEAVAREVMEEAGIQVKNVRYHSSQPWPFPSSLMIGCLAEAATTDIHMDEVEMTDVQWFDRSEVLLALEEKSEKLMIPGPIAIAHHLIKAWALGESG